MVNNDESGLDQLNRQLESMERMLKKADEYNETLSNHINKLKDLLKSNQRTFQKLQNGQQDMKQIFQDVEPTELQGLKLVQRLASIENKLFVTVSLYSDYKCRVLDGSYVQDDDVESKLCNQLNLLGANLLTVAKQLSSMRRNKLPQERGEPHLWSCNESNQTNKFWTQCKTQMQDMLQIDQLTVLQTPSELHTFPLDSDAEKPIRQLRFQNKIIRRVESILTKAEHFNIRSQTLSNVKVLSKMILSALVKRNNLEILSNDKNLNLRNIPDNMIYNPYL